MPEEVRALRPAAATGASRRRRRRRRARSARSARARRPGRTPCRRPGSPRSRRRRAGSRRGSRRPCRGSPAGSRRRARLASAIAAVSSVEPSSTTIDLRVEAERGDALEHLADRRRLVVGGDRGTRPSRRVDPTEGLRGKKRGQCGGADDHRVDHAVAGVSEVVRPLELRTRRRSPPDRSSTRSPTYRRTPRAAIRRASTSATRNSGSSSGHSCDRERPVEERLSAAAPMPGWPRSSESKPITVSEWMWWTREPDLPRQQHELDARAPRASTASSAASRAAGPRYAATTKTMPSFLVRHAAAKKSVASASVRASASSTQRAAASSPAATKSASGMSA